MGNTSCYKYDHRGRKIAEWGTAIQPACFGYDEADNMTTLTTFRDEPASNEDGSPCQSTEGAAAGSTTQPIQWSSEFHDSELALVYYNYRHYNPVDGRWGSRDFIHANNLYNFCNNDSILSSDYIGLWQNVNGDTLYKAGSKDTLFGLAKNLDNNKVWESFNGMLN